MIFNIKRLRHNINPVLKIFKLILDNINYVRILSRQERFSVAW